MSLFVQICSAWRDRESTYNQTTHAHTLSCTAPNTTSIYLYFGKAGRSIQDCGAVTPRNNFTKKTAEIPARKGSSQACAVYCTRQLPHATSIIRYRICMQAAVLVLLLPFWDGWTKHPSMPGSAPGMTIPKLLRCVVHAVRSAAHTGADASSRRWRQRNLLRYGDQRTRITAHAWRTYTCTFPGIMRRTSRQQTNRPRELSHDPQICKTIH